LLTRRVGLISGVAVGLTSVSFGIFVSFTTKLKQHVEKADKT